MSGWPTSPAWTTSSEPHKAISASSRSKPCVSEISPILVGVLLIRKLYRDAEMRCGQSQHRCARNRLRGEFVRLVDVV